MKDAEILKALKEGKLLLIDKTSLHLMLNAFKRDAEAGIVPRGEIRDTVLESVNKLNEDF